jgi:hypothetical protein
MATTIRNQFDYESYIKPKIDEIGRAIVGRGFLHLAGFYSDKPTTGAYGQGELSDTLRITFINGILNSRTDYKESLQNFSASHGGMNIHYVFNPTEGWTWDLYKCMIAKLGFVTPQAKMLAQTWKKLIDEMGGVRGGGKIIHYCHSIGGTHTEIAKTLMNEEELKMIEVISIGSASILDDSGFFKVTNYVSRRDGVSMLDPLRWFDAWQGNIPHTHFIGSWYGIPFIDHPLVFNTYEELIHQLGNTVVQNYL